jgi:hypothetical protein
MSLVGYFEGIGSQRGIAWRCSDSLSLREFLGIAVGEDSPDHSSLSNIRDRLPAEVHEQVLCPFRRPHLFSDGGVRQAWVFLDSGGERWLGLLRIRAGRRFGGECWGVFRAAGFPCGRFADGKR